MFAIKLNRNDAAKILIKGGADINELTTKGITPLIVAIKYKNKDFINCLKGGVYNEKIFIHIFYDHKYFFYN